MDWETIIKLKSVNDGKGANDAKKDLKEVGDEAERTAARTAAANSKAGQSFGLLSKGIAGVQRAMGTLRNVVTGFGLIGVVMTLVSWFKKLYEWIDKSTGAAQRLRDEANLAAVVKNVEAAEERQRAFNDQIRQTLKLMDEENSKADAQTSRRRSVEDARLKLEEAQALSGVEDPSERSRIQNDFARRRAEIKISRAEEDEALAKSRAAQKVTEREVAVYDAGVQVSKAKSEIVGMETRAELTSDPEKKKEILAQRKRLEALLKEAEDELQRQKELLERAREAQKAVAGMSEATIINAQAELQGVANSEADRQRADAARKAEEKRKADEAAATEAKKAAEVKAAEETVINGKAKIANLESFASSEQARAQAAADAYDAERADVINAQNRYDMLVANGGSRKDRSAALAALQKEQGEAEEAKHEMERVAAQVANTLQGIHAQIKALASAVKKAEGRLAQNQADAPEGV